MVWAGGMTADQRGTVDESTPAAMPAETPRSGADTALLAPPPTTHAGLRRGRAPQALTLSPRASRSFLRFFLSASFS